MKHGSFCISPQKPSIQGQAAGLVGPGAGDADLAAAGGDLGVFLLANEVELGGADVAVAGEFPHLVRMVAVKNSRKRRAA